MFDPQSYLSLQSLNLKTATIFISESVTECFLFVFRQDNDIPDVMDESLLDLEPTEETGHEDEQSMVDDEDIENPNQAAIAVRKRPAKVADKVLDFMKNKKKNVLNKTPDEIDLFFGSICMSVKKLPRRLQSKVKIQVLDVVSRAEEENESLLNTITPFMAMNRSSMASRSSSSCSTSDVNASTTAPSH